MKQTAMSSYARLVLRIIAGFTFCCHGMQKLFGFFDGMGGHGAKAQFLSLIWVAGFLEAFGGLLILLGLFTLPWPSFSAGKWRWLISWSISPTASCP